MNSTRPYGMVPPGFALPDDSHIGSVLLRVSDLTRSVSFYEQTIGLQALAHSPGQVELAAMGEARPLVRLQWQAGVRPVPRRGRFGLYHFAILLPDRAALGRAAAHLVRRRALSGMADHLVSEALYLSDPDGLGIEIYADRPSSTWRHRDRELEMTTEPLDVENVIAEGGDMPWTGAPPGTRIGHVHLHVGRLAEAEAFYHGALGFEKTVWSYPGALFMSAGGYHHHLGTNTWSPGPSPAPDEAQLLEWELVVPDVNAVAAAARSLTAAGHAVAETSSGWIAADPWGTTVRIVAR